MYSWLSFVFWRYVDVQTGPVGLDLSNQSNDFDLWIKPSVLASIDVSALPILTAYHRLGMSVWYVTIFRLTNSSNANATPNNPSKIATAAGARRHQEANCERGLAVRRFW